MILRGRELRVGMLVKSAKRTWHKDWRRIDAHRGVVGVVTQPENEGDPLVDGVFHVDPEGRYKVVLR